MANGLGQRIKRLRGEPRRAAISDVVARWRESGASQVAFSRTEGISRAALRRWIAELDAVPRAEGGPVLVEIGRGERPARDAFDLTLPDGVRIGVPPGFHGEDLARILHVLAATC